MNIRYVVALLAMLAAPLDSLAQDAEVPQDVGRFVLHNGAVSAAGTPDGVKVTLMVDTKTGDTWVLVEANGPVWVKMKWLGDPPSVEK